MNKTQLGTNKRGSEKFSWEAVRAKSPDRTAWGLVSVIIQYHPGHLTPQFHAVIGSPILGVYLGCVGQIQTRDGRSVTGNPLAVVNSNDGLSGVDLVMEVYLNTGAVKVRVNAR